MEERIDERSFEESLVAQFQPISLTAWRAMFLQTVTTVFNERMANKSYAFKAEIKQIKNQSYSGIYYVQLQDTDVTITAMVPEELITSMNEGDSGIFCGVFMTRTSGDHAARFDTMLFRVTFFQRHGVGELYEAKENLRVRLQTEGILNREPKPFPLISERGLNVVIVSNVNAKGYKDIKTSLDQTPSIRSVLKSCNLMNSEDIVRGINDADNSRADVLIVARGGGDGLGIFDREEVVRAIASCQTYTIAAIGHADDTTLANEVSDYAVITPTMAATYILDRMREYEMKRQQAEQRKQMQKERELAERRHKELLDAQKQLQKMLETKDSEMKTLREQTAKQLEEKDKQLKAQQEATQPKSDGSENKVLEALTNEIKGLREQLKTVTQALEKSEDEKKSAMEHAMKLEAQLTEAKKTPVSAPAPAPVPVQVPRTSQRPGRKSGGMLPGNGVWILIALIGLVAIIWALR